MASNVKSDTVFLLVPGSFATPVLMDPLAEQLKYQGYDARHVALLSANDGTVQPAPTMLDDAAHIRTAVLGVLDDAEHPQNVVLALSSYAGFPGTESLKGLSKAARAAEGKATAVIGIVYAGAFVPAAGASVRSIMRPLGLMPPEIADAPAGSYMAPPAPAFAEMVFNDLPSEEAAYWFAKFVHHSSDSYDGQLTYEGWRDVAAVSIIPGSDLVIPTAVQEDLFAHATGAGGKITRVFLEGTSHAAPMTQKQKVAEIMVRLAEEQS
jgi:hypothetical protein